MRWAPRGFGGDRMPPEEMKRLGWQAQRVLVIDAQSNRNRFDFTETSEPTSIPPSEFHFTPPAGIHVMK